MIERSPIGPSNFIIEAIDIGFGEADFIMSIIEDSLDYKRSTPVISTSSNFPVWNCFNGQFFNVHLGRNAFLNKVSIPSLLYFNFLEGEIPWTKFHLIGSPHSHYRCISLKLSLEEEFSLWRLIQECDLFILNLSIDGDVAMLVFALSFDFFLALFFEDVKSCKLQMKDKIVLILIQVCIEASPESWIFWHDKLQIKCVISELMREWTYSTSTQQICVIVIIKQYNDE